MKFADIPNGESVFLDANTLNYHFSSHAMLGAPCQELIERIARRELSGFTSSHVLSNVAHRLMTIESCETFTGLTPASLSGSISITRKFPN